ncbi:hypothetical protein EVG20_g5119 [Dentipellis fragilis]|uniref:Cyclopropane-fatty-acyl-phospholipid synthase n=1 Tax=Dentipellis fragilis TaxID=205917 RepID=A0A4Y9YW43_9AGAM|nr:hypothetical protein EVG20_g5119 [Dentipellis fragilis]
MTGWVRSNHCREQQKVVDFERLMFSGPLAYILRHIFSDQSKRISVISVYESGLSHLAVGQKTPRNPARSGPPVSHYHPYGRVSPMTLEDFAIFSTYLHWGVRHRNIADIEVHMVFSPSPLLQAGPLVFLLGPVYHFPDLVAGFRPPTGNFDEEVETESFPSRHDTHATVIMTWGVGHRALVPIPVRDAVHRVNTYLGPTMEQPSALQHPLPTISLHGITSSLTSALPNYHSSLATFARDSIIRTLKQSITIGCLEIQDYHGVSRCGNFDGKANVLHIKVLNEHFWTQVLLRGDLGFSEAYMMGDVQVNDLKGVMKLWLENESGMANLTSTLGRVSSAMSGVWNALFGQTRSNARLNAIASYDQSNELFKTFLSRDMMYSCALWGDEEGGVRGDLVGRKQDNHDLESAQLRKIHHVLRKARVKPGSRVLEVGSGWGSMAIEAARSYGCQVDTLTLSVEQKKLAEERITAAGLQDHIRVHLMDYRELPADFEKAFDAFISIEMLEHVGAKYYDTYFRMVDWALKPNDATVVVSSAQDFMRKYMWPNSCLPSATVLVTAAHDASKRRFTLDSVENHSAHYPRTLREWDRRLDEKLTQDTLARDFPKLKADKAAFDAFKRKWQYLFAYAGAGFAKGYITCHMLTFIRERDTPISCD